MRQIGFALSLALLACSACRSSSQGPEGEEGAGGPDSGQTSGESVVFDDPAMDLRNQGDILDQEAARLTLAEQKRSVLVDNHLQNARDLMSNLRLEEAEAETVRALELDPANVEARELRNEIGALLGRPQGEVGLAIKELGERHQLAVQQLQAEATESLRKGKLYMSRGDYTAAVAELTIAQNHMRWAPASVEWGGMEEEVAQLLETAKAQRSQSAEQARLDEQREAYEKLKSREEADRARREAIVANVVEQSIDAFEKGDYDEAMKYAEQALRRDPRNAQAQEIRDAAFRAGRTQARADYVQQKNEQFKRWREELHDMRVPWIDIVTLPDPDFWDNLTEVRSNRRAIDLSGAGTGADAELRAQLTSTRIPGLQVNTEILGEVVDVVRTYTGLPLVVDPAAESAALDEAVVFEFDLVNPLSVEQALNIVADQAGEEVVWAIKHDAVILTTKEKARGQPIIYNHDVQDLVFGLTDFLGPRIDRLRLLDDMEDEDGGGPFGGIGERPNLIDISALSTLIQENVAVGSWEEEGISIDEGEGYILVVHTPIVQQQVIQFLNDLRRFSSSLVTIESKFMTVGSNWIQEVGVDFRGLDNPGQPFTDLDDVTNGLEDMASRGLDNNGTGAAAGAPSAGFFYDDGEDGDFKGTTQNFFGSPLGNAISNIGGLTSQITFLNDLQASAILRAVEKSQNFQLVNDQVLSVHNTQRAYVSVINQQAYIQDFDVEVAQFQAVADPQINVLTEGVVLDVRPTIHHSRKYLTLEIQPTVAKVVALRNFSSTLGGNTSPVSFQLPELQVQSVFTTAVIPDGASILLGGLTNIRNIERRAEVPWLAKIPIVGFMFKNEGYNDENETLMILIRATITDVKAELERLEAGSR